MINLPFDPIKRAEEVEKIIMKNGERKFYRFRFSKYYGGIVTADACGCCFLCGYCWNYQRNLTPEKCGEFYSVEEVVRTLVEISSVERCKKIRISGAEPILGEKSFQHLVEILKMLMKKLNGVKFILETNGLILGAFPEKIYELEKFKEILLVRISIKGWDEESFEKISGADRKYFQYPIIALKNLLACEIEAWPAVMYEIFKERGMELLNQKLERQGIFMNMEAEYLEMYPFVKENLKSREIQL